MTVITLVDCPPALRGDLTKWLQEISSGVYAGQISARVRDELWKRVRENTKNGRATMVFSTNNEQRMDFRVHNTSWEPINFDGLKLMLRPSPARARRQGELRMGFSKAATFHKARQMSGKKRSGQNLPSRYVVVDVETTGLSSLADEIIEIGAILVDDGQVEAEYITLVRPERTIPQIITELTGLTNEQLNQEGKPLTEALADFISFTGNLPVVSHNARFDYEFLRIGCQRCGLPLFSNRCVDTYALARRLIDDVDNYKLTTLAAFFGIKTTGEHRSIHDCSTAMQVYEKLIEIS